MTQVMYQCTGCGKMFTVFGSQPMEHLCIPRIMAAVETVERWEKEKQDTVEPQEFSVTIEKSDLAMGMPARINRLLSPAIGNNTEVRPGDRGRGNDGIDFVAGPAKRPNQSVGNDDPTPVATAILERPPTYGNMNIGRNAAQGFGNDDPVASGSAVNSGMGGSVLEQQRGNFNTRKDE